MKSPEKVEWADVGAWRRTASKRASCKKRRKCIFIAYKMHFAMPHKIQVVCVLSGSYDQRARTTGTHTHTHTQTDTQAVCGCGGECLCVRHEILMSEVMDYEIKEIAGNFLLQL